MSVNIHGKEYITVAERVQEAHALKEITITTEVLFQEPVVIKATVITPKGTFTGISAANPDKAIENQSPYEVAETSAVGRALGFAGYGIVKGIASADEMYKATSVDELPSRTRPVANPNRCPECFAVGKTHAPNCKIGQALKVEKTDLEKAEEIFDVPDPDVSEE